MEWIPCAKEIKSYLGWGKHNSGKTLTDVPPLPLTLIFKSLSTEDLLALRLVRKGRIHQTATKILKDQKIRQLRPLFPELFVALKADKKTCDLKTLGAIHKYLTSGHNARERFEAVKDNTSVTTLLTKDLLQQYAIRETESQGLIQAAQQSDLSAVISKLEQQGIWINAADDHGRTPLWRAVNSNALEMVQLLIKSGANVHATDALGWKRTTTLLSLAIQRESPEIVELLLKNSVDVNVPYRTREKLHYPLLVGNNGLEIVKLFLYYGADVNFAGTVHTTLLCSAVESNHQEMVKLLIEYGADVNLADEYGRTLLHTAVESNHQEMVKLLIEYGADVKKVDHSGWTPLEEAIWGRQPERIRQREGISDNVHIYVEPLSMEEQKNRQEIVTLLS